MVRVVGRSILEPKGSTVMKHWLLALLAGACLTCPATVAAQSKPTSLTISALDAKGEPVKELSVGDVTVKEDNVAREVLKVEPATEPLTVALLVDDSQALEGGVQFIRDAARTFVRTLADRAEIALITFGERPTIALDYSKDTRALETAVNRIFPRSGSGAYLLDALIETSRGLQKREAARPVIVVLMLEDVEFSNRYYEQVLTEIEKSGAALHVVAIGQPDAGITNDEIRNRNQVIAEGTDRTGGRRDQVLALSGTEPRMQQLANELLHQFTITYARPETLIPPQRVEVSAARPRLTVRAPKRASAARTRETK